MSRNRWLLVFLAAFIGWQLFAAWQLHSNRPGGGLSGIPEQTIGGPAASDAPVARDAAGTVPYDSGGSGLPPEAVTTLQLIRSGGPFPYDRDGIVFGNFEGRLPKRARGYYHEYTVPTPGINHRGARRIISGGKPPSEFYYTGDHYESFQQIGGAQ
jgi:ribonuclease T1